MNDEGKEFVIFSEFCPGSDKEIQYSTRGDGITVKNTRNYLNVFSGIKNFLYEVFLPRGYPDSVSEDYTWYQIWDTLQACCSTLSNMLAVQSVLQGVGVGRDTATPLSAALAWFTKDGVGMIMGISFAWIKGTNLDSNCKKWRLFADFINNVALCLELSISMLVDYAVPILCLSSALKSVVGVAGGATRSALTHHQAIRGNTADVAAKDGSQETLVNLVTMSVGVWLINTKFIQSQVWAVMVCLVFLHLWCNYRAVKSLSLKKINEQRYCLIMGSYMDTGTVATVKAVNNLESVILGKGYSSEKICNFSISIGESLSDRAKNCPEFLYVIDFLRDRRYVVVPELNKQRMTVVLRSDATEKDILQSFFHAVLLGSLLNYKDNRADQLALLPRLVKKMKPSENKLRQAIDFCEDSVDSEFKLFSTACEEECWNTAEHVLMVNQWRIHYGDDKKKV